MLLDCGIGFECWRHLRHRSCLFARIYIYRIKQHVYSALHIMLLRPYCISSTVDKRNIEQTPLNNLLELNKTLHIRETHRKFITSCKLCRFKRSLFSKFIFKSTFRSERRNCLALYAFVKFQTDLPKFSSFLNFIYKMVVVRSVFIIYVVT